MTLVVSEKTYQLIQEGHDDNTDDGYLLVAQTD